MGEPLPRWTHFVSSLNPNTTFTLPRSASWLLPLLLLLLAWIAQLHLSKSAMTSCKPQLSSFDQLLTADPKAPTPPPSWQITPTQVEQNLEKYISSTENLLNEIAALPKEQRTFDSVIRRMSSHDSEMERLIAPDSFLHYVSTDEKLRDASLVAEKKLQVSQKASLS